jgi:hypothetical protein
MTHGAFAGEKVFCSGSILRYRDGSQGNHQKHGQCNSVFHSVSFDFQNIFRDSFGVDQWIGCITKSLSGGLSKDRVSRGSGSLLAIPA